MPSLQPAFFAALLLVFPSTASAQSTAPISSPSARSAPAEPASPPAQHVHSLRAHLSLDLPAGWNLARHDGEISTFALDARTSLPGTRMDLVAGMGWNPFPYSTFAGALFYVSQTPRSSARDCADQASSPLKRPVTSHPIDSVTFQHGYAEHGSMCIESRDEVYTALRANACLRFDLVVNTFCTQGSGARELTPGELDAIQRRLESILDTVHFDTVPPSAPASRAR